MKMIKTGLWIIAVGCLFVQGLFAAPIGKTIPSEKLDARELKARMIRAYRDANSYHGRSAIRTAETADGLKPFSEGRFAFDRGNKRFLSESSFFHGGESAEAGTLVICNGAVLRYTDLRPCLDSNGEDINPKDLVREIAVKWPLNYHLLAAEGVGLDNVLFPMLLGLDPLKEIERVTAHSGRLTMQAVAPRAEDELNRPGLKITGWTGGITEKLSAMTFWLDPESFLITQIIHEAEGKGVVGIHEINVLRCDEYPLPRELFVVDYDERRTVESLEAFEGGSPHPMKGKALPSLDLKNLNGHAVDLTDERGAMVVVFWSSRNMNLKLLQRLDEWLDGCAAVKLYAINLEESAEDVRSIIEEEKLSHTRFLQADSSIRKALSPLHGSSIFILYKGRIVHTWLNEFHEITAAVNGLINPAPVSVLLEQGIYTEETVGDLERAIEIYSGIVADDHANRKYVAEALFRLGKCHKASGQTKAALEELKKLVKQYPEQEKMVADAKGMIVELTPKPLFPELVGCRLKYPVLMSVGAVEQSRMAGEYAVYQTDVIDLSWSVEKSLEAKLESIDVTLISKDGDDAKAIALAQGLPGSARGIPPRYFDDAAPGEYTLQIIGYVGGVETVKGEARVQIKPIMSAQLGLDEIQPNRDIRFVSAQQSLNTGGTIKTRGFINSDFVHIENMFDGNGDEVKFTETHEGSHYRYRASLNKPVATGEFYLLGSEGWKEGMIKKVSGVGNEFYYRMNHTPGGNTPTRRVEIFRLPKGAELLETTPADLPHHVRDGQVEILVDTVIPTGGSLLTEFRYRLAMESDKYVAQIVELQKKAETDEQRDALDQIEAITATATFHQGALVELAKLAQTSKHNQQRIVKASELASKFGYHTGALVKIANIAAEADRECEELDEILELVVLKLGGTPLVVDLARDMVKAETEAEKTKVRETASAMKASADYQTLGEALDGQKTMLDPVAKYEALRLQPAPWKDGDAMRFRLLTKAGMEIGHLIWAVNGVEHEGKACWKVGQRLVIPSAGSIMASHVVAEKERFIPVSGRTAHQLGTVDATYLPGKVLLQHKGAGSPREVKVPDPIYDHEQVIFLMRRLPLAEKYSVSFPVMSVLSGAEGLECRIRVLKRESIDIALGSRDCWKIRIQVYMGAMKAVEQTAWFTVEGHVPVRFVTDQMDMELAEYTSATQEAMELKEHGAVVDLPKGWFGYELPSLGKDSEIVRLLPPEMKLTGMLCKSIRDSGGGSPKSAASKDIKTLKGYYKNYTVREGSRRTIYADGLKVSHVFAADYEDQGRDMAEYRAYFTADARVFWFVFRMERGLFEQLHDELDSVINGLKIISDPNAGITPFAHTRKLKVEFTSQEPGVPFYCRANVPESKELEGEYSTPVVLTSEQNRLDVTILPTSSDSVRVDLRAGVLNKVSYSGSNPFRLQAGKDGASAGGDSRFQTFFTTIKVMDGDTHVGTGKFRLYRQKMAVVQLDGYVLEVDAAAVDAPGNILLKMRLLKGEDSEIVAAPTLTLKGGEAAQVKISAEGAPSYTIEVDTMEL